MDSQRCMEGQLMLSRRKFAPMYVDGLFVETYRQHKLLLDCSMEELRGLADTDADAQALMERINAREAERPKSTERKLSMGLPAVERYRMPGFFTE